MRGMPQTNPVPGMSGADAARQAREAAFAQAARPTSPPIAAPPPPGARQASPAQAPPAAASPGTAGLPPDAPKVAISGGVYSPSPAQRMLIVNGQVFNEGSEVAPGVTIDKIESRTAVLKFRGALFTVAY
jgi:general secretion pathway protein B